MTEKILRCPQCGHRVKGYFDHIDIECEHDMTEAEIATLMAEAERAAHTGPVR